jgi:hypothetical protein
MDTAGNSRGNYNLIHSTPNQAEIIILFMLRMKGILTNLEMKSYQVINGFIILLEKLYFVNKCHFLLLQESNGLPSQILLTLSVQS